MFQLGMPVLIELPDLQSNLELCLRLGLASLELSMNLPQYCPEALPAGDVLRFNRETGIAFSLHLPEELDLGSFHEPMRRGCLARAVEALRWAGEAGVKIVVMHLNPGVHYKLPDRRVFVYERESEGYRKKLLESFAELSAVAQTSGVALCLENTGNFHLPHAAGPLQELLDAGLIGLVWDTGHDGEAGLVDKPFILKNLGCLAHMHLHDYADGRCHLPLYSGCLDVAEALGVARERGITAVVEVKSAAALGESVKMLRERFPGV